VRNVIFRFIILCDGALLRIILGEPESAGRTMPELKLFPGKKMIAALQKK